MSSEFYIGIASYKRPKNQRTLAYLEQIGFDQERIILSVQTEEDEKAYRAAGVHLRVGKFLFKPGRNASENRNTILDELKAGEKVVLLDDDITEISRLRDGELVPLETLSAFESMVKKGYSLAAKHHTAGFGIYPVHNAFFMSEKYRARNIADATLLGLVNTGLRFNRQTDTKEDFELCCEIIRRYGAFVRMENYACKAQHHSKGGCEEFWKNTEENARIARLLVAKYPDIIQLNPRRPGEVKMKRRSI